MAWRGAGSEISPSKPLWRLASVKPLLLSGIWYCTEESLSDSAYLATAGPYAFSREVANMLDAGIVRGSGSGEMLGALNAPSLITVAKETGQEAGSVYPENINRMWARVPPKSRRRGVWLVNADCADQLDMADTWTGSGKLTYEPSQGPYMKGRPVFESEHASTVGTLGDVMFIDPEWYGIVWRSLRAEPSLHVQFVQDEVAFRFSLRANGLPLIASTITPTNGSNSLSPFVTLETRS